MRTLSRFLRGGGFFRCGPGFCLNAVGTFGWIVHEIRPLQLKTPFQRSVSTIAMLLGKGAIREGPNIDGGTVYAKPMIARGSCELR